MALLFDPAISLLTKRMENRHWKGCLQASVHTALFTRAKREKIQVSINRWIGKQNGYVSAMEYYSSICRNEVLPQAITWMTLENIKLSELRQPKNDKCCMILFIWIGKFLKTESTVEVIGSWGEIGSNCLMVIEFQFWMMNTFWIQIVVMIVQHCELCILKWLKWSCYIYHNWKKTKT